MAKRGKSAWSALKGKKETATEEVPLNIFGEEVIFTVKYREPEEVYDIYDEYEKKMPEKPKIEIELGDKKKVIQVPVEQNDEKYEMYKAFNTHPDVKIWEEKVKPINKEMNARLTYEFLIDEDKPANNPKEAVKIIQGDLRTTDIAKIVNAGTELMGIDTGLKKQEATS